MYQLRTPAPALRPFIEHYWFVTHPDGERVNLRVDVFVDARADLIFNFDASYRREVIGGEIARHRRSNLDAQRLVPIRITQRGLVRIVGVRFHLGGLGPLVRGPLAAWTNRTPPPALVFGDDARALEQALDGTDDIASQARLLDAFFLGRLAIDGSFPQFDRVLRLLVGSDGRASVEELGRAASASHRQVDRLFARYLGIAPKTVAGVLRFQSTLRALMRDPECTLAEVAVAAGYFDQAHFIKAFKRMSGGVPRGYRGYYPPAGPADFAPNVVVFLPDAGRARGRH